MIKYQRHFVEEVRPIHDWCHLRLVLQVIGRGVGGGYSVKRYPWAIFPNSPDCQTSPDAYDLQNIATHEIGHWIGLDDLFDDSDKDLTMYAFGAGGEVKKRTLGQGDISGKNQLAP